ncbi:MAG: SLC13 family permease, partial [Acidimicrobiales bacterium]
AAVPLAVLLDRLGFFESMARLLSRGRHMVAGLWVLAAAVTTVLNLDASVVLLTPLYVRVARRTGRSPLALAFQPVLLAALASSALPVSNLTNLIVVAHTGIGPLDFLAHLGPPSLAATVVGWWCYRGAPGVDASSHDARAPAPAPAPAETPERRPLVLGGAIVVAVLVGFVAGPGFGVQPWEVAAGADVVLAAAIRRAPIDAVPWGTALLAAALAVLADAATSHLPVASLLGGTGALALARTTGLAALAANVGNNLPSVLVAVRVLPPHSSCQLWAVLVGVNMGPVVLATGALASLLWLDALGRLGVEVRPLDFTRMGVRVGLPALGVALGVLLGLGPLLGCG